jgi:aspartate carbamoyltransferase catalytic subunit
VEESVKNFLLIADQTSSSLSHLIDRSFFFKNQIQNKIFTPHLKNKFVSLLFFENSTRTKFSFEVASKNLGTHVLNFDPQASSLEKGETLEDTLRTLQSLGVHTAVIRHSDDELIERIGSNLDLALINAGAGKKEHPTQALLDYMTMMEHFGTTRTLKVGIVGDIVHSRVATSNYLLLKKFGHEVVFSGPKELMPLYDHTYEPLDSIVKNCDVIMMLRMQKERHHLAFETHDYLQDFGLTLDRAKKMNSQSIILHPAPINWGIELEEGIANLPQSRIFQQMENGVYARMAVLDSLTNKEGR